LKQIFHLEKLGLLCSKIKPFLSFQIFQVGHAATSMKHIPLKDVFALMKASEIFAF
jgi:hypothetical protein